MVSASGAYSWSREGGYELSTSELKCFKDEHAFLPNNKSIKTLYDFFVNKLSERCDDPVTRYKAYLELWRRWSKANPYEMSYLRVCALSQNSLLTDSSAKTDINPARALSEILNEMDKEEDRRDLEDF